MIPSIETILEGSFEYFQANAVYSQENFKLLNHAETQTYRYQAEILSRIENGEFLKVIVQYETNQHFTPNFVRIEKSIGNKYAQEIYKLDLNNMELHYTFQNSYSTHEFKRTVSAKHYLTSPALCTSTVFTLTRKFDATGRTPIVVISSDNDWEYAGPPTEKTFYAEFKTRDMDFQLNGSTLSASHLCLYDHDSSQQGHQNPVNFFMSKHYAIPYRMEFADQKIEIKQLKRNNL